MTAKPDSGTDQETALSDFSAKEPPPTTPPSSEATPQTPADSAEHHSGAQAPQGQEDQPGEQDAEREEPWQSEEPWQREEPWQSEEPWRSEERVQSDLESGGRNGEEERATDGLGSLTLWSLVTASFLNAFNDNVFRWLAVGIGKQIYPNGKSTILALGGICLVLPFLFFAAPAGWLNDRFSKRWVIIGVKTAEIAIMLLGLVALAFEQVWLMFVTVFLLGTQSALFGPAKLGTLPESIRFQRLAKANGILSLTTFVAIILGTLVGNLLSVGYQAQKMWGIAAAAGVTLSAALVGWAASFGIRSIPPAGPSGVHPLVKFARDLRTLAGNSALLQVTLGIAFFWSLGALSQVNIDLFGDTVLGVNQAQIGLLLAALAIGIGLGNLAAGWISGGRIEMGLVPFGALGIVVMSTVLAWTGANFSTAVIGLLLLGTTAGLFELPLSTYLQHRSPPASRGAILAASNFLTFSASLAMFGVHWALTHQSVGGLSAAWVFLIVGLSAVPVLIYSFFRLWYPTVRLLCRALILPFYRLRCYGLENIPAHGGALLVGNHVSYADVVLLTLGLNRRVRFVAWAGNLRVWPLNWIAKAMRVILLDPDRGPKAIGRALQEARQALAAGELVVIYPEGQLTRLGTVLPFQRGLTRLLGEESTPTRVIPMYIDGLADSIFSMQNGPAFFQWPTTWFRRPVGIHFGPAISQTLTKESAAEIVRQAVLLVETEAWNRRKDHQRLAPVAFVARCRRQLFSHKIADSTGRQLTGGQTLAGSIALARLLQRALLQPRDQEPYVGVLVPPSVGATLANAALTLLQRVPVNLNYTAGSHSINSCIRQCGIRHVLTSRKLMERFPLELDVELVYLEDVRDQVTPFDRLAGGLQAYLLPTPLLAWLWKLNSIKPDDTMTVIFTSGSTGEPKGVVLSYHNITCNVLAFQQVARLGTEDTFLGILPFFHSFGYTVTLWGPLMLPPRAVYHVNPLEGRQVGKLAQEHRATVLTATPTFIRHYIKRVEPQQFEQLKLPVVGAEKLPADVREAFLERFQVPLVEGYGMTEMSPVVSVNVPDVQDGTVTQIGHKPGTVGRMLPGVSAKVVNAETWQELPAGQTGMLLLTGPNLMQEYLGRPDLTAEKIQHGWYITGDLATLDEDGFLTIQGRASRFSKIGGEMVPHLNIEHEINRMLGSEGEPRAAVTGVADPRKGERVVVLHTSTDHSPETIRQHLLEQGMPALWIPSADSFLEVEEIPVLGSGKIALGDVQRIAEQNFSQEIHES